MDCSDLLWDTEISPDGTAVVHKNTQGPPSLKIETVRGHWRQVVTGAGMCFIISYTIFLSLVYFSLLFYSLLVAYQSLPLGAGRIVLLLLTCVMELPLLMGFMQLFVVGAFQKVIQLYVKEELDIDGSTFTYTPKWPFLLHSLGQGQYTLLNTCEDTAELKCIEIVAYPPGTSGKLFITAGLQFGATLSDRDIAFVRNQVIDYLRSLDIAVNHFPPQNRKPTVLTATYGMDNNSFVVTFKPNLSFFRIAGAYLSLWLTPLCAALPIMWLHVLDEQSESGNPVFTAVWVMTHFTLYLYWAMMDLVSLRLTIDNPRGLTGSLAVTRRLRLAPCWSIPFVIADGWKPVLSLKRPFSGIDDITLEPIESEGKEVGQVICIDMAPPHATSLRLPQLPYHETLWLRTELNIACGKVPPPPPEEDHEV